VLFRIFSKSQIASWINEWVHVMVLLFSRAGMRTNLQGSWATVGVLTEKGQPKLSAAGKNFMVWKLSSLDGALVSVFLFGGSYTEHWKESAGAVFAVFNAKVRLDERVRRTNKTPEQW
jgi:minichromosome maintenance protein 10